VRPLKSGLRPYDLRKGRSRGVEAVEVRSFSPITFRYITSSSADSLIRSNSHALKIEGFTVLCHEPLELVSRASTWASFSVELPHLPSNPCRGRACA